MWEQGVSGRVTTGQGGGFSESGVGYEVSRVSGWEGKVHMLWGNAKMNRGGGHEDSMELTRTNWNLHVLPPPAFMIVGDWRDLEELKDTQGLGLL